MWSFILALLSLVTALIPLADHSLQYAEHRRQEKLATAPADKSAVISANPPLPPEVGQPNVIFHDGRWWKYENGQWYFWRLTASAG